MIGGAAFVVSAHASASDAEIRSFNIPEQLASISIPEFARQAGRQIVAPGELLRDIRTPPLRGAMNVRNALAILLRETDIVVTADDGQLIVLARRPQLLDAHPLALAESETVIVTGLRASLTDTTIAKRRATGFADSVFAENIGRFQDTNLAEALNRIPGITISREIDGSGVNVSVRGLGPNFTKVLLNDTQVAIASTGPTNQSNANREVDLNMFPVELFSQLTVLKSPEASRLEGGTAGTINMRSIRPFDNPGLHLTYSLKTMVLDSQGSFGPSGALIISDTNGPFGVLVGVTTMATRFFTRGYETAGWTTPNLLTDGTVVQCSPSAQCNTIGGGHWAIPTTVPDNVTVAGLVPGDALDQSRLLQLNPGLTISQLSNMLLPRLARPFMEKGVRSRYNGVASFEYRPSQRLHFYLDVIGGRISNAFDRADINWVLRNGAAIPIGVTVDANNVVRGGTFANAQWFLEARPYHEVGDFFSLNPGLEWQLEPSVHIKLQANVSRSHFLRDSPTILVSTAPNSGYSNGVSGPSPIVGGLFVTYANNENVPPSIYSNVDLNNPENFTWVGGRVNVTAEKRYTYTNGLHLDAQFGGDSFNIKAGFAYDEAYRDILGYDNSQAWQNAVCGDNPNVFVPTPNRQPLCQGISVSGGAGDVAAVVAGYPSYPGLGSGYSASYPSLTYRGSLIPQSRLASYLRAGPAGFILINYDAFLRDTHYRDYAYPYAPAAVTTSLGVGSGRIDEKNYAIYGEVNGDVRLGGGVLTYNGGLRLVQTLQIVSSPVSRGDVRNSTLADGGLFPNTMAYETVKRAYSVVLPSLSLRYEILDDMQVRAAFSRTMTRPNPSSMLPGVNFSDQSAASVSFGAPLLKPYYANNLDVGFEVYTGGEGMLGATAFRKSISGFTVTTTTTKPFAYLAAHSITYAMLTPTQQAAIDLRGGPDVATVQVSEITNSNQSLAIRGLEVTYVQPFDVWLLRYGLGGFGMTANATAIDQTFASGAGAIATGVSPITYNVTLYFENDVVNMRAAYVFNGSAAFTETNQNGICFPNVASQTCPAGAHIYNKSHGQLDLSANLKLSSLFGSLPSDPVMFLDIQNLTKSKLRSYFQYREAMYASYAPGTTFMIGARGAF